MQGKWIRLLRKTHMALGVFFSPLLLLFIITGWWQTLVSDDDKERGFFNTTMEKFSTIHTDNYFPRAGVGHHSTGIFKILVVAMSLALITSILLGLALAWQTTKNKWLVAMSLLLGILIPAGVLYFI